MVQYLLDPAGPGFRFAWTWVALFLLMGMLATVYSYAVQQTNHKLAPITRMSKRVRSIAWTIVAIGLVVVGMRAGEAQLPLVQSRLLLYLLALSFLGLAGYVVYFMRRVLPKHNAAYEQSLIRRQYMRPAKRKR